MFFYFVYIIEKMEESDAIVELLEDLLGDHGLHYPNRGQISFNCPVCDDGRDKHNLEINYINNVYKCWSCGDVDGTHGSLGKLFDKYGNRKLKKLYNVLKPETVQPRQKKIKKLVLPEGFTLFKDSSPVYPVRRQAYNYLKNRGITDEIIEKYNIGFCDRGSHLGRIVVPSYDSKGELNYYIARSWDTKSKFKYKNPEAEKDKIIFNERLINWNKDIYLVEGVFDGFFLDNSIPMLGKHMSEILFEKIYTKSKGDIIIALDGDAWNNAVKLYRELNGGELYDRIKIVHLPMDQDVCDLRGNIEDFFVKIRD
jgi:DNA primase